MWKKETLLVVTVFIALQLIPLFSVFLLFLHKTSYDAKTLNYRSISLSAVEARNETIDALGSHENSYHLNLVDQDLVAPRYRCGVGLKWTSLKGGTDNNTAFFSAYYDERKGAPSRPAVIVLGYHMKSLKNPKLRCFFTFQDKSSKCSSKPVEGLERSCFNSHDDGKMATSYTYICSLNCTGSGCSESEIPLSVAMSSGQNCDSKSEAIPVQDCRLKQVESRKKKLGVCPSPVYNEDKQDIVEFIEMNKALGVNLVTLYLMPGLNKSMIQFLRERYSKDGTLEMFQWREMYMNKIVHYNAQLLATQDCMYRNMYRVEYLIITDLDELIIPLKHTNYVDMIKSERSHSQDMHSFGFLNRFFAVNETPAPTLPNCSGLALPKYFHRTYQLKCAYDYSFRPKYIVIPYLIIHVAVHDVCQATRGRPHSVSPAVAILGHFRNNIPDDCRDRRIMKQAALVKYQSKVTRQICS